MIRHHLTIPGLLMAHIELPRALEDYFAFAETTPTRNGRRFLISLPYFSGAGSEVRSGAGTATGGGAKLDRLQWWFHVSPEQERQMGEAAIATLRAQATEKFCRHIERWLQNTRQRLHGDEPIPRVDCFIDARADAATEAVATTAAPSPASAAAAAPAPEPVADNVVAWPGEKVANG
jgi:hypothetical protein